MRSHTCAGWIAGLSFLAMAAPAFSQAPAGDARGVYRLVAPAVFTVEMRGSRGQILSTGTAFLIEGNRLVTNAHVVERGTPHLRVESIALPLRLYRVDEANDLAVLTTSTPIEAKPLVLATRAPEIGTSIYAIGSPQGLDRTISPGIISARRDLNGRELVQITAPVSPGSSGGPAVDGTGTVVGIVVGLLPDGQNLNFAVPVSALRDMLRPTWRAANETPRQTKVPHRNASPSTAPTPPSTTTPPAQTTPLPSQRSEWRPVSAETVRYYQRCVDTNRAKFRMERRSASIAATIAKCYAGLRRPRLAATWMGAALRLDPNHKNATEWKWLEAYWRREAGN